MQGKGFVATAAPFNVDEMRRQLGDDDALIGEVVQLFLDDCPSRMAALTAAMDRRDAPMVRRAAHAIKGGASNFFAAGVVEAAAALEMKAAGGDLTGADELATRLSTEMHRLVTAMTELRPGN
jgi:HPt (histidine-containing phosphotransfer) domain-containing protein